MRLIWVAGGRAEERPLDELGALIERDGGFLWLDIEELTPDAETLLTGTLGIDRRASAEATSHSLIPRVRMHEGALVLVLQSIDADGHIFQLDEIVAEKFLVTIHDRFNKQVPLERSLEETEGVAGELLRGEMTTGSPLDLAYEIGIALAERIEKILMATAEEAGKLDRRMREGRTGKAEEFLEELFSVRHDLVTIYNRASQTAQAFGTAAVFAEDIGRDAVRAFTGLAKRFERLTQTCDGERRFLGEVLEFHEHRTNTKMNLAMERLSVIAAVVLPINALAGIIGMNTIVNADTDFLLTGILMTMMASMAGIVLVWTKKKQWW